MTQEEKDLLIKDLSARVFYGVKVNIERDYPNNPQVVERVAKDGEIIVDGIRAYDIYYYKPYLRPMSSMTDSEIDKLFDILHIDKDGNDEDWIKINDAVGIKFFFPTEKWVENVAEAYDYLNSIYIDYRGLIPKGLALKAKEGMYKQ